MPSTDGATSSDAWTIRLGTVDDASAVSALATNTFTKSFGYSIPPDDLKAYLGASYSEETLALELEHKDHTWFVARDKSTDELIGFAQLTQGTNEPCLEGSPTPTIEFQRMYVGAAHHGKGVAKVLFQTCEDRARALGAKTIWLGVWEDNAKAQRFYEKMGYHKVGSHDFVMGTCVQTDFILRKLF